MRISDHPLIPLSLAVLAMVVGLLGGRYIGSVAGMASGSEGGSVEASVAGSSDGVDVVGRGREVFAQSGCANCHGSQGEGGVANPNSETGELVPALVYVREAYTAEELKALIQRGVPEIGKLDPDGPPPPLVMPSWEGVINARRLDALVAFLFHLYPEEEELDW
jgi:mono/diheme cytochrome c family protein